MRLLLFTTLLFLSFSVFAQKKFLFDASKAETAGNADWIIDADHWNLDYTPYAQLGGNESNAQRFPTPSQNNVNSNTAESYWKGALSSWGIELVKAGYEVETLPYNGDITYLNQNNPQDLSNYDVFVVCEPNIKFTSNEKSAILAFVKNGGSLFMISDHTNSDRNGDGFDSPFIWNDLMFNNSFEVNPFGIKFDYEFFNLNTYSIIQDNNDPLANGPYGKVTKVEFYGGTTMTLFPSENSTVKGVVYKNNSSLGGNTNVMCAYASYGEGRVAALGDSSPPDDGTGDYGDNLYDGWLEDANGNHRKLIMNASVWLASSTVSIETTDFKTTDIKIFYKDDNLHLIGNNNSLEISELKLFDITGHLVVNFKNINLKTENSLSFDKKGFFVYRIYFKNGKSSTGKLLIN